MKYTTIEKYCNGETITEVVPESYLNQGAGTLMTVINNEESAMSKAVHGHRCWRTAKFCEKIGRGMPSNARF